MSLSCETSCEASVESTYDLYTLLPQIIRDKSLAASSLEEEGVTQATQSVIRRLVNVLNNEFNIQNDLLEGLVFGVNPEMVAEENLNYLAYLVGGFFDSDWELPRKRMFVESIVYLWKASGTPFGMESILRSFQKTEFEIVELKKTKLYEDIQYSNVIDYGHTLTSARIAYENGGTRAGQATTEQYTRVLNVVRPIHVLPIAGTSEKTETTIDSLGEVADDLKIDLVGSPLDIVSGINDGVTFITSCINACQSGCQTSEEYACAGSCETSCETLCESSCQNACETGCESGCQMSCEFSCEAVCESSCEYACEDYCETSIEGII
jgi:phage tail-like protein